MGMISFHNANIKDCKDAKIYLPGYHLVTFISFCHLKHFFHQIGQNIPCSIFHAIKIACFKFSRDIVFKN